MAERNLGDLGVRRRAGAARAGDERVDRVVRRERDDAHRDEAEQHAAFL